MQLRFAGSWAQQNRRIQSPCWIAITGSIELGIFDEPERRGTEVIRDRSPVRTARRPWPVSARLLVGAMLVLNILLAAFLVRTEIKRPGAPAISAPLPLERPKAGSSPQLNAPADQGSSPGQGSGLGEKTPPAEVTPDELPATPIRTRTSRRPATKALRAGKAPRPVWSAPMPRTVIYPPQETLGRTSAPVRDPAASSGASVNIAPPRPAASSGSLGAGARGSAGPPPSAPAASALSPPAPGDGLAAKGTRSGSVAKVASVGLPALEKGLSPPKPVASVSQKFEIVPRPPVKLENCGDDKVFVACPTLKIRYDTPYTSEDP